MSEWYCPYGSCDRPPGHDGHHRCRCGTLVDEYSPKCEWHMSPKRWDIVAPDGPQDVLTQIIESQLKNDASLSLDFRARQIVAAILRDLAVVQLPRRRQDNGVFSAGHTSAWARGNDDVIHFGCQTGYSTFDSVEEAEKAAAVILAAAREQRHALEAEAKAKEAQR